MVHGAKLAGVAAFTLIAILVGEVKAAPLALTLTNTGPNGAVTLGGLQTGTYAAGVLDWKDTSNTPYYSYCIDVSHVISLNTTYYFNPLNASPYGSLPTEITSYISQAEMSAIGHLFADHVSGTGAPGNLLSSNHASITAANAAQFQVALWELVYDTPSAITVTGTAPTQTTQTSIPLWFKNLTAGDLQTATNWAKTAVTEATAGGNSIDSNLIVWASTDSQGHYTNPGQNQAFFSYTPGTPTVPLPSTVLGGLTLLGMLGVSRYRSSRKSD